MALPAPVQIGGTQNKTDQPSTVITTTAAAPAGSHIAVFVGHDADGVVSSVTDSAGNTYAKAFDQYPSGGDSSSFVRLSLWVAKNITALPSGGTITVNWSTQCAAKGVIAVNQEGQDPAVAWNNHGSRSGTGPTANSSVSYVPPYPPEAVAMSAVVLEGANSSWSNNSSFLNYFPREETSGQGSASNIKLGVAWALISNPSSAFGYRVDTDIGVDYSAGGMYFQPLIVTPDKLLTKPTAWRIQTALAVDTAWSIPKILSVDTAWSITGPDTYTPAPVLVEAYTIPPPYTVELPVTAYSYVDDAETAIIGRKRLYPIQITTLFNYTGSLSAIAEWVDPATDPTWIANTAVGQNAYSQLKVKFPFPPQQPADTQIFYYSARKAPAETEASATIARGWSIDGATPVMQDQSSVGATPIYLLEFRGSSTWTTSTSIELLLMSWNSYTGHAPRGAWEPGAIAWDFIHDLAPEPGREIFIVSKTILPVEEPNVPPPPPLAVLVQSTTYGPGVAEVTPLLISSTTGAPAAPELAINSISRADGEMYDAPVITITAEVSLVDVDIQINITAIIAARATPELPVEAAAAIPAATPMLAVQAATSDPAVTAEVLVTSSARDGAIYPGLSRTLTPYLTVGGVDLSSRLSGPWSITREEGRVAIAEFSLRPNPGTFDVGDAIRSPVRFGYRIDGAEPVILFTGVVDEPAYDPHTRRLVYTCTDNLPRVIGALARPQIDALTPGAYWSPAAANPDADAWEYAQARMDTVPGSLDLSVDGQPRVHPWAAAETPHFTFKDGAATGNFVDRTLRLSRASWREFVNEVTVTVEARYQRRVHRDASFRWSYGPTFQGYLTDTSPLPTEDTVRAAAEQAGWAIKHEQFTRLPPSGVYFGIIWTHNPDNPPFWILEANLTLARRWDETVTERATYTVRAPASIARFGPIREQDRVTYTPDPPADTDAWLDRNLDQRASSGAIYAQSANDLDGFTAAPGGVQYRDDTDPAALTAAAMTGLLRAVRRILGAHRQHTAEVTAPLLPEVDVVHTAEIQATGLTCRGKVREVIHRGDTDIAAGPPQTTIRIAVSQCDGAASVTPTPIAPAPTTVPAPDVLAGQPALGGDKTHLGNRWYSPAEDPDWDGWVSNYTIPNPVGATKYDERFVIDLGEYAREPIETTASATFDVDIPHDSLLTTA